MGSGVGFNRQVCPKTPKSLIQECTLAVNAFFSSLPIETPGQILRPLDIWVVSSITLAEGSVWGLDFIEFGEEQGPDWKRPILDSGRCSPALPPRQSCATGHNSLDSCMQFLLICF